MFVSILYYIHAQTFLCHLSHLKRFRDRYIYIPAPQKKGKKFKKRFEIHEIGVLCCIIYLFIVEIKPFSCH